MHSKNDKALVNEALDQVKEIQKLRSDRQLALMLDLAKRGGLAFKGRSPCKPRSTN
jgi:hypothetical protein